MARLHTALYLCNSSYCHTQLKGKSYPSQKYRFPALNILLAFVDLNIYISLCDPYPVYHRKPKKLIRYIRLYQFRQENVILDFSFKNLNVHINDAGIIPNMSKDNDN